MGLRAIILNRWSSIRVRAGITSYMAPRDGPWQVGILWRRWDATGYTMDPEDWCISLRREDLKDPRVVPLGRALALIRSAGVARGTLHFFVVI